ncbi:MAG: TatD family hydrolase [Candidatus Marinimicrobia bacterium]|nr:TatD family hydrolase [Candidatus Neomarinimicrobiota bacterium]MCF7840321.1 TatD family hydrolase [Candidatus Neomarinimicrobiota bacterium]MCF7902014.1 TatD family hydrolase [Candidatus Neomarinimicrobiota bacterium]
MSFIDTHCHLNLDTFTDRIDAVLEAAAQVGVKRVICIGIDIPTSERAVELAEKYPQIYAAAGIHPNDCVQPGIPDNWEQIINDMLNHPKVVAVGETGLDYYWDDAPPEQQKKFLQAHLELAKSGDLPIVLHNRDSDTDMVELLTNHPHARGVLHCWSAPWTIAQPLLEKGYHISFTGSVTFKKNTMVQDVAQQMPLDRLMVETDSPFLTPAPFRGKKPNEPKYIPTIAQFIADLRGLPVEDLAGTTTRTAEKLFRL